MRIYGIDFTSAPSERKPIACVACTLEDRALHVDCLVPFPSFEIFENFLASTGPWIAGLDFPFGQPRGLVEALGWPRRWEAYVGATGSMRLEDFEAMLRRFRERRPPGRKHLVRRTDRLAGAVSPMMLYRVPVGKMFLAGAPRLARSPCSVLPCRPTGDERVVVEAYPSLLARRLIGRRGYKQNGGVRDERRDRARRELVERLVDGRCEGGNWREAYGFGLRLAPCLAEALAQEPSGDFLDAVLCAVQAAWAGLHRRAGFGIPESADRLEGWIAAPEMLSREADARAGTEPR